jgi:hypothetical protein
MKKGRLTDLLLAVLLSLTFPTIILLVLTLWIKPKQDVTTNDVQNFQKGKLALFKNFSEA